jgi:hypothetical protein
MDFVMTLWVLAALLNLFVAVVLTVTLPIDVGGGQAFCWHPILLAWAFLVWMTNGVFQVKRAVSWWVVAQSCDALP